MKQWMEHKELQEENEKLREIVVNQELLILSQRKLLEIQHGFIPVVPPKKKRLQHWEYDKELYINRSFLVGLGYTKTSFSNELFIETLFKRAVLTFVISIVFVFYLNDNN